MRRGRRPSRPRADEPRTAVFHRDDCANCGRSLWGRMSARPAKCPYCGEHTSWDARAWGPRWGDSPDARRHVSYDDHCATCHTPLVGRLQDLPDRCPCCERPSGVGEHPQRNSQRPEPREQQLLIRHFDLLTVRDQEILLARWEQPPQTLEAIGQRWGVCRERVRQVEGRGVRQLRVAVYSAGGTYPGIRT
jgi:Sigma-70, region 4